jgi:hypothetical protein
MGPHTARPLPIALKNPKFDENWTKLGLFLNPESNVAARRWRDDVGRSNSSGRRVTSVAVVSMQ